MNQPNVAYEVQEKVEQLKNSLLSAHPQMPILLRTIHTQLKKDPEIVTLLSEEEIGIILSGLKKQTQTEISVTISKAGKGKSLKSTSVDDL